MMEQASLRQELGRIAGADNVLMSDSDLEEFSQDMTEAEAVRPACVVRVTTVEQIQDLLRFANQHGVPITPRVAGTNLGGLTIPAPGGVVLDLRSMNRIHAVDEGEMYAIVEPGVTFGQLREYLDAHHPDLVMGYPLAPPETSILANCVAQGLVNLSLRHGSMDEWVNGFEVVLPTAQLVRTGSMAVSTSAFGRVPLPDLSGLFIGFQGTTGVITKASVELYPAKAERFRGFILNHSLEGSYQLIRRLARLEICDDLAGISWPAGKMLFGIQNPTERDPDEPEFFLYMDISAHDPGQLQDKLGRVQALVEESRRAGFQIEMPLSLNNLVRLNPGFGQFADFPTRLSFLLDHPGGGLTWVGLYGPSSRWEAASRAGERLMVERGIPPTMVSRPMKNGHFCVLRFITLFDKHDQKQLANVRALQRELAEMALGHGFVPYKTPPWMVRELLAPRLDPGFADLVRKVKSLLDPNGIMNPGKWDLG